MIWHALVNLNVSCQLFLFWSKWTLSFLSFQFNLIFATSAILWRADYWELSVKKHQKENFKENREIFEVQEFSISSKQSVFWCNFDHRFAATRQCLQIKEGKNFSNFGHFKKYKSGRWGLSILKGGKSRVYPYSYPSKGKGRVGFQIFPKGIEG